MGGVVAFTSTLMMIACGSDAGSGGPADVDRAAAIASIGTSQLGEICDWANAQLGGYGKMETCSNGVNVHTFANRDTCAAHPFPSTCAATVGEYEDCVSAMARGGSSLCALLSSIPPACQALIPSCAIVFS